MSTFTPRRPKRWSPLTCLVPASLSQSGLIILESNDGEVVTLLRTNVELRYEADEPLELTNTDGDGGDAHPWNARDVGLSCHVTTHRIVLVDERDSIVIGGSIPLPLVESFAAAGGPSIRSPLSSYKIELNTFAWGKLTIVFRGGKTASYAESKQHRDDALAAIEKAMAREAWNAKERLARSEDKRSSKIIAGKKVGLDRIVTKTELHDRENANIVHKVFGGGIDERGAKTDPSASVLKWDKGSRKKEDIDAFLREADVLVKIIHTSIAKIERARTVGSAFNCGEKTNASVEDTDKLFSLLENMGNTSALSKKQAGSTYHPQLARQLVDFLRLNGKLTKAGGMMTLTDVYCLFNRARGTNMIAPEDLLKAVDLMKELNLGITKRSFKSGVLVIQADEFDDNIMGRKLTELASISMEPQSRKVSSSPGGITVMDVCRELKISALLANEQLVTTEEMGLLCRDSTIEGVRFFPNLFITGDFSLLSGIMLQGS